MTRVSPPVAEPLVSVTIPVFNGERYVADSLSSVLAQTYRSLEVIVVDDGSTDASVDVVRRVTDGRGRILRQARGGAAAARNVGVAASRGPLLAFLDADDTWPAEKLDLQVRALTSDPTLDMVFGHYITFGDQGEMPVALEPQPGYSLGTMLITREGFLRVGPLSTRWRVGEFIDWYARAEEAGLRHAMLPDVLLRRRAHDANLTAADRGVRADYARIVRAVATRRALLRNQGA